MPAVCERRPPDSQQQQWRWGGAPSRTPLAVLGVLSHATPRQQLLREAIRNTWANDVPATMAMHFVLRSGGMSEEASDARREADRNNDVLLLPHAAARTEKGNGALSSLLGWFACALNLWPRSTLVGKAEDDVYLNFDGITRHLAMAFALVPQAGSVGSHLYWGTFETSHWATGTEYHTPRRWMYWYTSHLQRCWAPNVTRDSRLMYGPFAFVRNRQLDQHAGGAPHMVRRRHPDACPRISWHAGQGTAALSWHAAGPCHLGRQDRERRGRGLESPIIEEGRRVWRMGRHLCWLCYVAVRAIAGPVLLVGLRPRVSRVRP